jgi:hypothetical protein
MIASAPTSATPTGDQRVSFARRGGHAYVIEATLSALIAVLIVIGYALGRW